MALIKPNGGCSHRMDRVSEVRNHFIWNFELSSSWILEIVKIRFFVLFYLIADTIWSIVQVTETGTLALTQQLAQLKTNTSNELALIPKQPIEVNIGCLRRCFKQEILFNHIHIHLPKSFVIILSTYHHIRPNKNYTITSLPI